MNRHDRIAQASQDRKKSRATLKFQAQKAAKEAERQAMRDRLVAVLPALGEAAVQFTSAIDQLGQAIRDMKIDLSALPSTGDLSNLASTPRDRAWMRALLDKITAATTIHPTTPRTPHTSDPANETEQEKAWRAYATSRRWA